MYYINNNLPGLVRTEYHENRDRYLRMDLNENPGGLEPDFVNKVLKSITPEMVAMYPEQGPFTEKLAAFLGVQDSQICLTNGSAEALRYIIEAYTRPNGKIVTVSPSYAMYEVYANMYGRIHIPVTYNEDLSFDVNRIIEQLKPDIDLLVVLNPNNPVGDVYTDEEMDRIIAAAKENEVTVMIDEAYHYFYPKTFMRYALENDYVFVTRTFSKLFSIAGCRLGYAIGRTDSVAMLRKLCTPHNINIFAMKFAEAVMDEPGLLESLIERQTEGKKYLIDELQRMGYKVSAKEGNFLFVLPHSDPDILVDRMKKEKGILIKTYSGIGSLGKCLRLTTGEKKYMEMFVKALAELDR